MLTGSDQIRSQGDLVASIAEGKEVGTMLAVMEVQCFNAFNEFLK